MEQIRSFIAIGLPDDLTEKLGRLEDQLKSVEPLRVKWVNPESIHLTLKFLGNIDVDSTGQVTRAIEEAIRGIPPFSLTVKDLGVFPNQRRPQVAWVGLSGEVDELLRLQQGIEVNLGHLGFAPEPRAFAPHLTLARLEKQVSLEERQRFGRLITGAGFEAGTTEVRAVSLMKSELSRQGAVYTRISSVRL